MASGHASSLAQARSCFPSFWKGLPCHGAKREQPHTHEHCWEAWLELQSYYLNRFTEADRVTWHEDLLLDGDTAADVREGTKTGNFAGLSCCSSLHQCYLTWFVFMLIKFNGKFRIYTFKLWGFSLAVHEICRILRNELSNHVCKKQIWLALSGENP